MLGKGVRFFLFCFVFPQMISFLICLGIISSIQLQLLLYKLMIFGEGDQSVGMGYMI